MFIPVQQSSFYGLTGMLPARYTQAVMTGESRIFTDVSVFKDCPFNQVWLAYSSPSVVFSQKALYQARRVAQCCFSPSQLSSYLPVYIHISRLAKCLVNFKEKLESGGCAAKGVPDKRLKSIFLSIKLIIYG